MLHNKFLTYQGLQQIRLLQRGKRRRNATNQLKDLQEAEPFRGLQESIRRSPAQENYFVEGYYFN